MKNIKQFTLLTALAIALFSCKKEAVDIIIQEESHVQVTHHYIYGDQESTVVYGFNEDYKVISSTGDIASREAILSKEKKNEGRTMLVEHVNDDGTEFTIHFFDSYDEMNTYQGIKVSTTKDEDMDLAKYNPCYNNGWGGNASFRFYKHTDYNSEIGNLTRLNHAFFQIHYLNSNENDQISSLSVSNGVVDLFEHGCFFGTQIRFLHSIPNLHYFFASTVAVNTPSDPVDYIGSKPTVFFPANKNFGDVASSIKGWSI